MTAPRSVRDAGALVGLDQDPVVSLERILARLASAIDCFLAQVVGQQSQSDVATVLSDEAPEITEADPDVRLRVEKLIARDGAVELNRRGRHELGEANGSNPADRAGVELGFQAHESEGELGIDTLLERHIENGGGQVCSDLVPGREVENPAGPVVAGAKEVRVPQSILELL